MGSIDRTLRLS